MGCHNMVGFYSNLPIKYGDDIVYFICGSYGKVDDIMVIETNELIEPICLPIFGKYDEYGSIEDIVNDENVNAIEQAFGMNITDIIDVIEENSFITMKSSKDAKHLDKRYIEILEKVINSQYFNNKDDFSLCVTMEHRKVYDTMATLFSDGHGEIVDMIDNVLNYIEISEKQDYVNILNHRAAQYNIHTILQIQEKKLKSLADDIDIINKLDEEELKEWKLYLNRTHIDFDFWNKLNTLEAYLPTRHFYFNMIMYNVAKIDFVKVKDDILKFLYFNESLRLLCGKYTVSSYGLQDLTRFTKQFSIMNDCYKEIIDKIEER